MIRKNLVTLSSFKQGLDVLFINIKAFSKKFDRFVEFLLVILAASLQLEYI